MHSTIQRMIANGSLSAFSAANIAPTAPVRPVGGQAMPPRAASMPAPLPRTLPAGGLSPRGAVLDLSV